MRIVKIVLIPILLIIPKEPNIKPDNILIVSIDAGHGTINNYVNKSDPCKEGTWSYILYKKGYKFNDPKISKNGIIIEELLNQDIAYKISKCLKKHDTIVIFTRITDCSLGREENFRSRAKLGNLGDIFISIHTDGTKETYLRGYSIFIFSSSPKFGETAPIDQNKKDKRYILSLELAEFINGELKKIKLIPPISSQNKWNIPIREYNIKLLNRIEKPSVLIELGFLSNPRDAQILSKEKNREKIAKAICKGIIKFAKRKLHYYENRNKFPMKN